jgi:hypothetical protein
MGFEFSHGFINCLWRSLEVGDKQWCLLLCIESYFVPTFSAGGRPRSVPARGHSNVGSLSLILAKLSMSRIVGLGFLSPLTR